MSWPCCPGRPKINNWAYETVEQPGLNGRKGYQPRGKTLGGSSAINAMLYIRGHQDDYDHWAEMGCDGWSFNEVLPLFKRAEGNERGEKASFTEAMDRCVFLNKNPPVQSHALLLRRPINAKFAPMMISTAPSKKALAIIR